MRWRFANTSAAVKAIRLLLYFHNAVAVPRRWLMKNNFVPDKYLADYVSKQTGRKLISYGFCPTHVKILPRI